MGVLLKSCVFAEDRSRPSKCLALWRKDARVNIVPYVNTWLWPSVGLVASSSLFFSIYIGKVTNAHEWKEIMLDYCHHKRTYCTPHLFDRVARMFTGILKIAPK